MKIWRIYLSNHAVFIEFLILFFSLTLIHLFTNNDNFIKFQKSNSESKSGSERNITQFNTKE